MADRSQNILINYKFNTAEIDKANAILNRANQSTNQLQAEAGKAGQKISQSFTTAGQSIQFMTTRLERLKTQISISSDPKQIAALSNQYKILKTQIDAATKSAFGLPKALKETKAETQSLTQQFGNLYKAAQLLITASIVREVVNIGLEMATLKGNVEGVEAAFKRAIPNEVAALADLRRATHGTLTDFQLMQKTLKAENLGVPVENLGTLLEFAAVRAQQTGDSVDYLVNSIIDGLGRKSILKLDNLGISATRLKDAMNGVSTQTATVAQVTEAFSKIAGEELQKMGGYAETSATQVSQLKTEVEELRITLAKKIESGWWIDFLKESAEGWQVILKGRKQVTQEFLREIGAEQAARVKEGAEFKAAGKDRQKQFDVIQQEINTRVELIGRTNDSINAKKNELKEAQVWSNSLQKYIKTTRGPEVDAINEAITALEKRKFVQASAILALKDYLKEIQNINDEEEKAEPSGIISRKKKEIEELQKALELTNDRSDLGAGGRLTRDLEIAQAELGDLQRAFREFKIHEFKDEVEKNATETLLNFTDAANGIDTSIAKGLTDRLEKSMAELANLKLPIPPNIIPKDFWDKLEDEWEENWRDILGQGIDLQADIINAELQTELDNYKRRLRALGDFYDQQQLLAGDNEKAKSLLRIREERETSALNRKIFEKEKQTRRSQALIDGAAGVAKAFATYPYPAAIIISALIAAQTIAQVRTINRQRSGYAKGVFNLKGPGTETSDSIPVNLSRGESVMTAWQTKNAGDVIKEIQAKKLDNKVLRDLKQGRAPVQQQQFNDERIIKAIEKNRPPDVLEQSGIAYEVKSKGDNYRIKVRSKSGRFRI